MQPISAKPVSHVWGFKHLKKVKQTCLPGTQIQADGQLSFRESQHSRRRAAFRDQRGHVKEYLSRVSLQPTWQLPPCTHEGSVRSGAWTRKGWKKRCCGAAGKGSSLAPDSHLMVYDSQKWEVAVATCWLHVTDAALTAVRCMGTL